MHGVLILDNHVLLFSTATKQTPQSQCTFSQKEISANKKQFYLGKAHFEVCIFQTLLWWTAKPRILKQQPLSSFQITRFPGVKVPFWHNFWQMLKCVIFNFSLLLRSWPFLFLMYYFICLFLIFSTSCVLFIPSFLSKMFSRVKGQ